MRVLRLPNVATATYRIVSDEGAWQGSQALDTGPT